MHDSKYSGRHRIDSSEKHLSQASQREMCTQTWDAMIRLSNDCVRHFPSIPASSQTLSSFATSTLRTKHQCPLLTRALVIYPAYFHDCSSTSSCHVLYLIPDMWQLCRRTSTRSLWSSPAATRYHLRIQEHTAPSKDQSQDSSIVRQRR